LKEITSTQNPLVKKVIELKTKASSRREEGLCIIEGQKEVEIAIQSGIQIVELLIDHSFAEEFKKFAWIDQSSDIYSCSSTVMEKIAIRDTKQKILAIAKTKNLPLSEVKLSSVPFILIIENIEKPGNIGALLRTSDAANVDAILCTNMQTDLYNHNVIRNSLGCIFSKQVVLCSNEEALTFCQKNKISTYATYLHTDKNYYEHDFKKPTAIIFGTESTGISDFWRDHADHLIKIPMLGKIDSMNVSNSASILLYELVRQRITGSS
jgi:RNA methyltransferase, TrmH family